MTVRHVVLFDFSEAASEAEIAAVIDGLNALPASISEIRDWSLTPDLGGRPGSYRFCLIAQFDDMAAVDRYLRHPDHERAVARGAPILTKLAEHDHAA